MNIIQISPYFYPNKGGVQKVVEEITKRLSNKNNVILFTSDIGCNVLLHKIKKNSDVIYLKGYKFANTPIIPSLFFKLMRIPKSSIMHIHIAQAFLPEVVYLASKIRKIPYIAHLHADVVSSGWAGFLLPFYKRFFLKKVLLNAEKVIVLNEEYARFVKSQYSISNCKIIPNGVSESFFINKKLRAKAKDILYVGRLSKEKNVMSLVNSVRLLNNVRLHIVGGGTDYSKIKEFVEKNRINNVILYGEKEGNSLLNFYKEADIFVLPSKSESFGIVLLEAMASGTPIIASDIPGIKSIIKNGYNGILVRPTSKEFAMAIQRLIDNPRLRQKLARNGLKEAKKYSWNKIVKQIEQVYREVIKKHNEKNKQ